MRNNQSRCLSLSDIGIVLLLVFHFKFILGFYVVCLQLFLRSDKLVWKIIPDNGAVLYMDNDVEKKKIALVWFFFSKIGS